MMAVSYSRWTTHKQCGLKYRFQYVDKIAVDRGEPSPALERGNRLHDNAENYVLGNCEIDPDLAHVAQRLFFMKENFDCSPEQSWGFDWEQNALDFDDESAELRGLWDLLVKHKESGGPPSIFEYKTGKVYDDHKHQRHLYGLAALIHFPEVPHVEVITLYFDQKKEHSETFTREQVPAMLAEWKSRVEMMNLDGTWIPNPSWLCRYCDFSKDNGGPCRF